MDSIKLQKSGRLEDLFENSIPESLNNLSKRSLILDAIIEKLENDYLTAQRLGKDRNAIEIEAKSSVSKSLLDVLNDIDVAATKINDLVGFQSLVVDNLSVQVEFAKNQLTSMKEKRLTQGLDEMSIFYPLKSNVSIKDYINITQQSLNNDTATTITIKTKQKKTLKERLTELEFIGGVKEIEIQLKREKEEEEEMEKVRLKALEEIEKLENEIKIDE
jgi:hypothetical protein